MKKTIALLLILMLTLSFAACGGRESENPDKDTNTLPQETIPDPGYTAEEFRENHRMTVVTTTASGGRIVKKEYACEEGYALVTDESIRVLEVRGAGEPGVLYQLDPVEKTGSSMQLSTDEANAYEAIMTLDALSLYNEMHDFPVFEALGAEKIGCGAIAGRPADIYLLDYRGVLLKFWIAEGGLTLKRVTVNEAGEEIDDAAPSHFKELSVIPDNIEVTEIQVGGVTLADAVDLDEYIIYPQWQAQRPDWLSGVDSLGSLLDGLLG